MAQKVSISTFEKGMNLDSSKVFKPRGTYDKAKNIRLAQNEFSTNLAISNVLGNKLSFTIPNTSTKHLLTITSTIYNNPIGVVIDGITTNITSSSTTIKSIRDDIYDGIINNSSLSSKNLIISKRSDDKIVIASRSLSSFLIFTNMPSLSITTLASFQSGLTVIGYANLRDDLVLFTSNVSAKSKSNLGQIWLVKFDSSTNVLTPLPNYPKLIYNGNLGFSKETLITAIARYETEGIQKVYWTDNYNFLRFINISDPNVFGLDENSFQSFLNVNLNQPTIVDVTSGGNLPVGVVQYAYKLIGPYGNESFYSACSPYIHLTSFDESIPLSRDYRGAAEISSGIVKNNSGKAVKVRIDNIDKTASKLRVVAILRTNSTGSPDIKVIKEVSISGSSSYEFIHSTMDSNESIDLSLQEFILNQYPFDTCKTVETKDNRLLIGNTSSTILDLNFDSRVYRYPISSSITYTSDTINKSESDDINPYNQDPTQAYKYQKNSTRLGGTGPNISYTFKVLQINGDDDYSDNVLYHVNPNNQSAIINLGDGYTHLNKSFNNYKSPYLSSLVRGYRRGETYRFGIVFFDKKGSPGFAKWIGDIRMPEISDVDSVVTYPTNNSGGTSTNFSTAIKFNEGGFYTNRLNILYPEFTVNIPSNITSLISGYQIIRVKREEIDRTCRAQGIVGKFYRPTGGVSGAPYRLPKQSIETVGAYYSNTPNTQDEFSDRTLVEFDSPEVAFFKSLPKGSGDFVQVVGTLGNHTIAGGLDRVDKWRSVSTVTDKYNIGHKTTITDSLTRSPSQDIIIIGGEPTQNYIYHGSSDSTPPQKAWHGTSLIAKLNSAFNNSSLVNTSETFLVDYRRLSPNQYGGATTESRAVNEYIEAGSYISINSTSSYSGTIKVFGGDTFVCYFDYQRVFWDINQGLGDGTDSIYEVLFFPVETTINLELRHDRPYSMGGVHVNTGDGALYQYLLQESGNFYGDLYQYNTAYSIEPDLQTYFPKPIDFIDSSKKDCNIFISDIKLSGESTDSWTIFRINNSLELESTYGSLNRLIVLRDKVFFFQNKGLGIVSVNPRVMIPDSNGERLQLGTGRVLERYDYISSEIGSVHQFGITKSDSFIYFVDINKRKMYRLSFEGLEAISETREVQSWFQTRLQGAIQSNDNILYTGSGISCEHDHSYGDIMFTFYSSTSPYGAETIVFNERVNSFTSFYDFMPYIYIKTKSNYILSIDTSLITQLFQHNIGDYGSFYNITYPSNLSFSIFDGDQKTKTFDDLWWITEVNDVYNQPNRTWTKVKVTDDYQSSGDITLIPGTNIKRIERQWNIVCPRNAVVPKIGLNPNYDINNTDQSILFKDRMRDKYLSIELEFDNSLTPTITNSPRFLMPYFQTVYRTSDR